jgi:hypothetical protein
MSITQKSRQLLVGLAIAVAAAGLSTEALGEDHFRGLPVGAMGITFGSGQYFFHAGVWFRPVGTRFEVITPPVGIVIPALPPGYVTLTIGGAPFFYANGVYYVPAAGPGFAVVDPPAGADAAQPVPPAAVPAPAASTPPSTSAATREPVVYPRNGQSAAQTESDRAQCRQWAAAQAAGRTGDPTAFDRAFAACLDGRGYTVR